MEMKSPPPCPSTVTVRRNPPRRARPTPSTNARQISVVPSLSSTTTPAIPSFPIQDILSMEILEKPQNPPQPDPSPLSSSPPKGPISENLKVYLRIRPLLPPRISSRNGCVGDPHHRARAKNAWPRNPANKTATRDKNTKKNSGEACVTVCDSHSITLVPPLALQESKRIKSEVYQGFSHVFPPDSSQGEVYKKMVKPLVEDFLKGKSGMLVALGPSGSGKTHTVFGSPREPGMVPLTLQQIFKQSEASSESSRSFSLSIFEIYSERGKGEKVYDLVAEGTELSMQQSTIKGLKEVVVSDAGEAESLIACAMLKRVTGTTNANSQSSRSQCIINISSIADKIHEVDNNAILTIVDLAGAEREKRTGNQGTRLLESNFINNTSMVFGLCLRSLLEHQKNPKKPLQKHFQNSLLTKYLRDYLEGKKRMTLILTVKEGIEDYLDTSHLLRQASPYTKIKFNVEESSNMPTNKRHFQAAPMVEQPKKMKLSGLEASAFEERKSIGDEQKLSKEETSRFRGLDVRENATKNLEFADSTEKERNHQIMQSFAKAIWNVLKQYKQKLKVAEGEILSLQENLSNEKTRCLELGKELEDLKSCCTCSKGYQKDSSLHTVYSSPESKVDSKECDSRDIDEKDVDLHLSTRKTCYDNTNLEKCNSSLGQDKDVFCQIGDTFRGSGDNTEGVHESKYLGIKDNASNAEGTDIAISYSLSHGMVRNDSCSSVELDRLLTEEDENFLHQPPSPKDDSAFAQGCSTVNLPVDQPIFDAQYKDSNLARLSRDCSKLDVEDGIVEPGQDGSTNSTLYEHKKRESLDPLQSREEDEDSISTKECNVGAENEPRVDVSCKAQKPKRRLAPASSILLRDFSTLDVEEDAEKPKGNRAVRKLAGDERKTTTEGGIALLRLLKDNLHL